MLWILPLALGIALLPGQVQAQDVKAGQAIFSRCSACHQIGPKAQDQFGPHLNGVLQRPAGTVPGHDYTDAMRSSGIVWDDDSMAEFLRHPEAKVPGTRMRFAGLKSERDISDLIAFLKTFDSEGKRIREGQQSPHPSDPAQPFTTLPRHVCLDDAPEGCETR